MPARSFMLCSICIFYSGGKFLPEPLRAKLFRMFLDMRTIACMQIIPQSSHAIGQYLGHRVVEKFSRYAFCNGFRCSSSPVRKHGFARSHGLYGCDTKIVLAGKYKCRATLHKLAFFFLRNSTKKCYGLALN